MGAVGPEFTWKRGSDASLVLRTRMIRPSRESELRDSAKETPKVVDSPPEQAVRRSSRIQSGTAAGAENKRRSDIPNLQI
jgi:hypothetical protein